MKIKDGFVKCKIGEKYLVVTTGSLSAENNIMIELNETSSEIWELISKGFTAEEIAFKLADKYQIPVEKAKTDTDLLIENMKKAEIFEDE